MALLDFEGFEGLGTTTGVGDTANVQARLQKRYSGVLGQGNGVFLTDSVDGDGFALAWGTVSTANANEIVYTLPDQKANTVIVGLRFKSSSVTATAIIVRVKPVGFSGDHIQLQVFNTADLRVLRNFTLLGTASNVITAETWHFIEFKFHVDNTNGSFEVRVDGTTVLTGNSVDTQDGGGSALVNEIRIEGFDSVSASDFSATDDIYIVNTTGLGPFNNFLGDHKVLGFLPNGEGAQNDWTPSSGLDNSALVDEDPESDTDYVESNTVGQLDRYNFEDATDSVIAVRLEVLGRVVGDGTSNMRLNAHTGATTANGSDQRVSDPDSEVQFTEIFDMAADGSSWNASKFNSHQFGMEVRA